MTVVRSYILSPYTLCKDARTGVETQDVQAVLDGDLDPFIKSALAAGIKTRHRWGNKREQERKKPPARGRRGALSRMGQPTRRA